MNPPPQAMAFVGIIGIISAGLNLSIGNFMFGVPFMIFSLLMFFNALDESANERKEEK